MVSLSRLRGQGDQIGRSLPYLKKVIYQITLKRLSRIFDSQETSGVREGLHTCTQQRQCCFPVQMHLLC